MPYGIRGGGVMVLAQVIPINPTDRVREDFQRLPGMAFIPVFLDDLGLSLQAFRVFCHLCRRARLKNGLWIAYPSLEAIGRICFLGTYPNAKAPRLRILAARAIEELERRGLLKSKRDRSGNEYEIHPMSAWVSTEALEQEQQTVEPENRWTNPNARTRVRRSPGDLKTDRSPGDLSSDQGARSPGDLIEPETAFVQQFEPDRPPEPDVDQIVPEDLKMASHRSPGDHNGNSINQGSLLIKKRERDLLNSFQEEGSKTLDLDLDAGANFSAIDEPQITVEYSFEDDQGNPIDEQNLGVAAAIETPETVAAVAFDPESYNWSAYPGQSCAQVPIEFWRYSLGQVEAIKRERDAAFHPKPIGDPESYCRGMLQKQGLQRYLAWRKQFDVQPAFAKPAPGIHWGSTTPVMDVDMARSLVKQFWRDLGLGWEQPDLLAWMAQAEAMFEGFAYNPKSGFPTMPDAVVIKLCSDLQTTLTQRLGGQNHG
jgi:hypothetical protein